MIKIEINSDGVILGDGARVGVNHEEHDLALLKAVAQEIWKRRSKKTLKSCSRIEKPSTSGV